MGKVEGFWMNNQSINDTVPWEEEHEKMLRRQMGGAFGRIYLLTPWSDWHLIKFSLQYYPWIKDDSHENRGNDHQLRKLLIFQQILLLNIIGNVWRTIRRICVLILRGKKLANRSLSSPVLPENRQQEGSVHSFPKGGGIIFQLVGKEGKRWFLMWDKYFSKYTYLHQSINVKIIKIFR